MRASSLAIFAHIIVAGLLFFALTETLLKFSIDGESLIELIQEVSAGEGEDAGEPLSRDFIVIAARSFNIDLETYSPAPDEYSVISGAERLFETGNTIAAAAIVLFSVIFPIVKLLSGFVHATIGGSSILQRFMVQFHRLSMLDVFVAAIVVFVISRSTGYKVELGSGFYIFIGYWAAQHLTNTYFVKRK